MANVVTEKDIIVQILKLYKKSPCLWDMSNKLYFNKQVRHECYVKMHEIWRQLEPDSTVQTVKKKLEHFRSAYRREWKRVANSLSNNTVHKPSLWYYNLLTFLNEKSESNKDSSDENNMDTVTPSSAKKKRKLSQTKNDRKAEIQQDIAASSGKSDSDDYVTTYGLTIAKQLRELDDEVRYEAERIISDVIYRARTGTLPKYSTQAVDYIIPQSGPSWYDIPVLEQPNECFVMTVSDPSGTSEQIQTIIKEENY